jgi:F-type H+-transporting ATPase subunit c
LPGEVAGNLLLQREPGCTVSGNHLLAAISKEAVMKKVMLVITALVAVLLVAPAAFAQGGEAAAAGGGKGLMWIAAIFGVGIAAFGCGLGQGRIGAAAQEGIARNPGAAKSMFIPMILALAFVETLVLLTFVTVFIVK